MNVFLVRHAETESNVGLRTSDPAAISLTENGKLCAIKLAESFNVHPDLMIVSSFLRTSQTAAPFVAKYENVLVKMLPLHEFTYLSPGACQNTTPEDRAPMVKSYWERCDPFFVHGAGAESFAQFVERVSDCLKNLKASTADNVLVFTHGQVMRMFRQLIEIGNQLPVDAMLYFRNNMLKVPVENLETWQFGF